LLNPRRPIAEPGQTLDDSTYLSMATRLHVHREVGKAARHTSEDRCSKGQMDHRDRRLRAVVRALAMAASTGRRMYLGELTMTMVRSAEQHVEERL
jgi:hypothetical protein